MRRKLLLGGVLVIAAGLGASVWLSHQMQTFLEVDRQLSQDLGASPNEGQGIDLEQKAARNSGNPAVTDGFVIIKDMNNHCSIIEQKVISEAQLTMHAQVGKFGYPTREEAEIDVRVLCDN